MGSHNGLSQDCRCERLWRSIDLVCIWDMRLAGAERELGDHLTWEHPPQHPVPRMAKGQLRPQSLRVARIQRLLS